MNTTIIVSLVFFMTLMLLLVLMLLVVKRTVTPSGKAVININDGYRRLEVDPGETLSATLAQYQIILPSACGGKGNCGQCHLRVLEGGGAILPTETGFFTNKQIADKWRLACQVKVSGDMKVVIPESVLSAKMLTCEVEYTRFVSKYYKEIGIRVPDDEFFNFHAGEYVQIYAPSGILDFSTFEVDPQYKWDWKDEKLFDLQCICREESIRAYTLLSYPGEPYPEEAGVNILKILVKIALPPQGWSNPGVCSSYLFSLRKGDKVRLAGPYGEALLPDNVPDEQEFIFIAGGAGMSLCRCHIFNLLKNTVTNRRISFFYGARSYADAFYVKDFLDLAKQYGNFSFRLSLDVPDMAAIMNGIDFDQGYVHQTVYDCYLKDHESPQSALYFVCGPPEMVKATREMLSSIGVPAESVFGDDFEDVSE